MIIKTFRTLQDDVLRWFDEVNTSTAMRDNVKQALNAAQAARLGERSWPFMKWPGRKSFTTVEGQKSYALHLEFFRPIFFWNATTQQWLKQKMDPLDKAPTSSVNFELGGTFPVEAQPSAASVLTLTSTSGSDGTEQQVTLRGEIASGAVHEETITVAGANTVEQFVTILNVTKIGTWAGTAILKAGTQELLRLAPAENGRIYQVLNFPIAPTAAWTIEYGFYRQPHAMEADNDVPDIPSPYQDILTYDTLIQLAAYNPVEDASLQVWVQRQKQLEMGLIETYGEALTLEREPAPTNYIPRF